MSNIVEKVEDAVSDVKQAVVHEVEVAEEAVLDVLAELKALEEHAREDVIGRAHAVYENLKALIAKIEAAA